MNKLSTKVAAYFGYEEEIRQTMVGKSLNAILGQTPLLSLLPYEFFDSKTELYHNLTSIGFVLEIAPLVGATAETIRLLTSLLSNNLPDTAISQWLLWASPKIGNGLNEWVRSRSKREGEYEKFAKKRAGYLNQGAYDNMTKSPHYRLRDFRCFVSLTLPKGVKSEEKLIRARDSIQNAFSSMGSATVKLNPQSFLSTFYDIINPVQSTQTQQKKWERGRNLSPQLISSENRLKIKGDSLHLGEDRVVTTYSVEEFPDKWAQHDNLELIGSELNEILQPHGEFFLNAVVRAVPKRIVDKRLGTKILTSDKFMKSPLAKWMPRSQQIHKEWIDVNYRLADGDKMVEAFYQIAAYSSVKEKAQAEDALHDLFHAKGWKIKKDKYIPLQSWLSLLPMRVDKALFKDLRELHRTRTIMGFNAANLLPLQGEWKGTESSCLLLFGRRGQMCFWDPFSNKEGNFNVAVAGKSGSGKSVVLQEIASGVVGSGGRAFIFDIGRSFEKGCRYLGGQFIEFKRDVPLCINPFTHIQDFDASVEMLLPVFTQMASTKRELNEIEESYLQQALKAAWQTAGKDANPALVAAWLRNHSDFRANDIGTMLFAYTEEGRYSRYVNGPCTLDFRNPYIVLELEELKDKKDLQGVVLMLLMYHVTEFMYRGDRKQRIICIIDEAWDLLSEKLGSRFIETGYRRAAKYNGAFISGTQSLEDYETNLSARAAKANADTLLILAQRPEIIEKAEQKGWVDTTPHFINLLKSLKTIRYEYSELCIKTSSFYSANRLILDPFSSILYSSRGEVVAGINEMLTQGFSMEEAVQHMATRLKEGTL